MTAESVFIEYLRENDLSMTSQRKAIVETFLETEGHFTAEELSVLVKKNVSDVGQATIYRTLKLLVGSGLADAMDFGDGVLFYEHAYGHAHHDHLICIECHRKIEIVDKIIEERQDVIAEENNFVLTRHRMYLYGICSECQKVRRKHNK